MESGYDLSHLIREARIRWLKPAEVFFILRNCDENQFTQSVPKNPPGGSLFFFNKRVLKSFRKDGHSWRKRKDQRTLAEAHERLKVGNAEALNCYYAQGDQNPNFKRRSYWMLDPAYDHIVLVHYREESESRVDAGPTSVLSGYSSDAYQHEPSSAYDESYALYNNESSPGSMEISSSQIQLNIGVSQLDARNITDEATGSSSLEFDRALRKLQRDLSLDDEREETDEFCSNNEDSYGIQYSQGNPLCQQIEHYQAPEHTVNKKMPNSLTDSHAEFLPHFEGTSLAANHICPSQQLAYGTNSLGTSALFSDNIFQNSPENSTSSSNTLKKFTVHEISPDWCYHSEGAKVIIVGSFLSHPLDGVWGCMFGETEVPVLRVQEGVFCCHAPPHLHGIVDICVTWNHECCSEVRKFEFRTKPSAYAHSNSEAEAKSLDELLLLVKLVQMLRGGVSVAAVESDNHSESSQEIFTDVINSIWDGSLNSLTTLDWIVQELLKDKLAWWFSSKSSLGSNEGCPLSKEEQGMLHVIAGLGFEWALQPLLKSGVGVNFRDASGWTALHWAAKFGREKMVTALIASGASAGLLTDPNTQDPVGQTPGSIASAYGHTALAGYLSEVALTSHLSSLTFEECVESKDLAAKEAERTVSMVAGASSSAYDDKDSLYHSLAAVRNAAQSAARIQAAFRAHSFRKRQHRATTSLYSGGNGDEYSILESDLPCFPTASKSGAYRNTYEHQLAAVSIQKKYKGWKGRKDFIGLRQKVIKIQAHARGYAVRKKYKVCWAVGILDKAILRWRRHRSGLRGFKNDTPCENEEDDEDILKEFRKTKVEVEIDKAVSRVLSMVRSPRARQQYHRIIKDHIQSKLDLENTEYDAVFSSHLSEISSSLGIPLVEDFPDYLVSEPDDFIALDSC